MSTTAPTRVASLAGVGQLTWLIIRRDRVRILCWLFGIIGLLVVSARSIRGLYSTPAEFQRYGRLVKDNAALIVQSGPGYGLDHPTLGTVLMNEVGIWTFIAIGLMAVFMVVRHTRAEEDGERSELIRSAPVGRHAPLAAAMIGTLVTVTFIAACVVGTFAVDGLPLAGSVAFGLSIVGTGAVFAATAAVAAQIAAGSRGASAIGSAAIAVAFVARAVGDVGDGRLSWASPIGWAQAIRAFADERWWVLALPLAATVGGVAAAVALEGRRDLGAGLLGQRAGLPAARPGFASPLALARRLHRPTIIGWTIGMALLGFFYGIVADQAETMFEENPEMADYMAMLGSGSITDSFLATSVLMMGLITAGYAVAAVLRMRSEELAARADVILATPTSRSKWMAGHLLMVGGGATIVMSVTGAAIGGGFASVTGDLGQIPRMIAAAWAMVPAILVVAGVAAVLYGLLPKWSLGAWTLVVFVAVAGLLQGVLDLPQWALDLSPFEHVPALPGAEFAPLPIVLLLAASCGLAACGLGALQRRDVG